MKRLGILLLVVAATACSGSSEDTVTIRGGVIYKALGCAHNAEEDTADKTVIVKDGDGKVLGTDTTGSGNCSLAGGGSTITSSYSVEVPHVSFYEISVEGVPGSLTRSYQQLKADLFQLDLDIGSSY